MSVKQKGFSLPELLIVVAIVGGISLVTMKLVEEQASNEALLKGNAEIQKVVNLLKTNLSNVENCRAMLRDSAVATPPPPPAVPTNLINTLSIRVKNHATNLLETKEILRANTTYPGFRTDLIYVSPSANNVPSSVDLHVGFRIKNKSMKFWDGNVTDDRLVPIRIPIIANVVSGLITDCGPVISSSNTSAREKFCLSLIASVPAGEAGLVEWDPAAKKCRFTDQRCLWGTIPAGLTRYGTIGPGPTNKVKCVPTQDRMDLNQLIDQTPCTNVSNVFGIGLNGDRLVMKCSN